MTYELAKQLKDLGFPQKLYGFYWESFKDKSGYKLVFIDLIDGDKGYNNFDLERDYVYSPTLSELIDACNLRVFQLTKDGSGYWRANGKGGDTAKEAVARLWLELHKSDVDDPIDI